MAEQVEFEVGMKVRFLGYEDNVPEDERVLVEGEVYEIEELGSGAENEGDFAVRIDNPVYDPKKKASKTNAETVLIDVFGDEVEVVEEEEEVVEEKPAARTRGKTAAKEEVKPAAKTAAKGKTAAKEEAKPAAKGKAAATKEKPAAKGKATATAKAKAKPAKEEKEEKIDPLDMDIEGEDEEIVKLVEDAGDELLDLALETVEEASAMDYKLGGILYHVRKTKVYQDLDDRYKQTASVAEGQLSGLQLYCQEQLGIDYRKAMELISIYVNFNLAGISGEKVAQIGWTKASKIARVLGSQVKAGTDMDKVSEIGEELVGLAEEQSVTELSETIKETYVTGGAGTGTGVEKKKKVKFVFSLFEDQAEGVKQVLEAAMAAMGHKKMDQTFEHIVMEWAAEHPVEEQETKEEAKASKRTADKAAGKTAAAPAAKAGRAAARASARA